MQGLDAARMFPVEPMRRVMRIRVPEPVLRRLLHLSCGSPREAAQRLETFKRGVGALQEVAIAMRPPSPTVAHRNPPCAAGSSHSPAMFFRTFFAFQNAV